MMRKALLVLYVFLLLNMIAISVYADDQIKIVVNGNSIEMKESPIIVNGRTLVPLRAIFESLGISPVWDNSTKTVTAKSENVDMSLQIGSNTAIVNKKTIQLEAPGMLHNGNTMIPVRFIADTFGASTNWDSITKTVLIKTNIQPAKAEPLNSKGTLTFGNGEIYFGDIVNGKADGNGTYTFPDGSTYIGMFKNGNYHGQGTCELADGSYYNGNFANNLMDGLGTYKFSNGSIYVGNFKYGLREGQGTLTYKNGDVYEGHFSNDMFHGLGTLKYANGDVLTCDFFANQANGQATWILANGDSYVGSFKNGKKDGYGVVKFANGGGYTGEFKNGVYDGQGTYYHEGGGFYSGIWRNGEMTKCDQLPDN